LEVFIRDRHRLGKLPDSTLGEHCGKVAIGYMEGLEKERDEASTRMRELAAITALSSGEAQHLHWQDAFASARDVWEVCAQAIRALPLPASKDS
jgi:hypothetical protein